jgi:hypothetical protein
LNDLLSFIRSSPSFTDALRDASPYLLMMCDDKNANVFCTAVDVAEACLKGDSGGGGGGLGSGWGTFATNILTKVMPRMADGAKKVCAGGVFVA